MAACGKFGLLSHIDGTAEARPNDADWVQADSCIRTWLNTSMADDVSDMAVEPDQTARELWVRTCSLFNANRDTRAVFLRQQFHSMVQGDLNITEYFHRLKTTADALRDVGRKIEDDELVLNALRGLNPRFKSAADIITFTSPLPDLSKTQDMLLLKESSEPNAVDVSTETALSASTGSCPGGAAGHGRGKGKGKSKGNGNSGGGGFSSNTSRLLAPAPSGPSMGRLRPRHSRAPWPAPCTGPCPDLLHDVRASAHLPWCARAATLLPTAVGSGERDHSCLQRYAHPFSTGVGVRLRCFQPHGLA